MYRVSQTGNWAILEELGGCWYKAQRQHDSRGEYLFIYLCKPKRQADCQNKNYGIESWKSWITE